jgi:hypothetical protein
MNQEQLNELLYQALETEIGGQQVYQTAIRCALHEEAREEWEKYLEETREHEQILRDTFAKISLDPQTETPGRQVVRHKAEGLVKAMEMALSSGQPEAAQIVAAESIVEAETKDHQNWHLLGLAASKLKGEEAKAIKEAHEQVEDQEDEHLYHTMGWARELWLEALGLPAKFPPPEEEKKVSTKIGQARAEQERERTLTGSR